MTRANEVGNKSGFYVQWQNHMAIFNRSNLLMGYLDWYSLWYKRLKQMQKLNGSSCPYLYSAPPYVSLCVASKQWKIAEAPDNNNTSKN